MKRKFLVLIIPLIACGTPGYAQKVVTLKECYDAAGTTSAIAGEKEAYTSLSLLRDRNLSKGWLPSLDAGGSFFYNSEVIDMGGVLGTIPIPGIADAIKPLPHEQYKLTLDINQVLFDGGAIKAARNLERADLRANEKQTETDLYKIRSQVNTYFFNIVLITMQHDLLKNYHDLITRRISSMQSALENGVILKSDLDIMTSEKLRLEQQIKEIEIRKASLVKLLSDITGLELDLSQELALPDFNGVTSTGIARPELDLFDMRKDQLEAGLKIISSKRLPKAFGFATLGYGNPPGNNFFRDEFAPYYVLGASIKWNIFDWNKTRNEKQIVSIQQVIIESRKNELEDNLKRLLEAKDAEIKSLTTLTATDTELIALRKRITETAESQYNNGTITATDYLNELNSEKQALINYEIHKINLALAKAEYLNICGKDL